MIASGVVTTLAGTAGMVDSNDGIGPTARFIRPKGVALDGAGNLYVSDLNTIRKVELSSGIVTTQAGVALLPGSSDGYGAAARFNNPQGLAVDCFGNLYVADSGNGTIRQMNLASATVTTLVGVAGQLGVQPGHLRASLNTPFGIAVSPAGSLYLTDYGENSVLEVR